MLHRYSGEKLRNLRTRALLTQMQVVEITGIAEATIHRLEHEIGRPQTKTLETLLNLYAVRIQRFEKMERIWENKENTNVNGSVHSQANSRQ
jgi:transcriptional regulator with XRE-family HTH domain